MRKLGLIGFPVAHSASPDMQRAALVHANLGDWTYELWPTPNQELPMRIAAIRADDAIAGFNITIPHKQAIVPFIDSVSTHARAIGAVNTVVKRAGLLVGDNTDWRGFLADLDWHRIATTAGSIALVLGAGGSARAIVYALLQRNVRVRMLNRDIKRAHLLALALRPHGDVSVIDAVDAVRDSAALIVNCTSAGMEPNNHTSPWPDGAPFPAHATLYDLVYKPRVTVVMRQVQAAGNRAVGGIGMLAEQGAAAFELWTGVAAASVSRVMRRAVGDISAA